MDKLLSIKLSLNEILADCKVLDKANLENPYGGMVKIIENEVKFIKQDLGITD